MKVGAKTHLVNGGDGAVVVARPAKAWAVASVVLAMVMPWINPLAVGPTPQVWPWLISMASAMVLILIVRFQPVPLVRCIGAAWLSAALISSSMGLVQFFGLSPQWTPWINTTGMGEAFGNLRQRNQFATLTNIGLAVLLWGQTRLRWHCGFPAPVETATCQKPSFSTSAAATLLALGNAVSSSRTGLLQLALLVLVVMLSGAWRRQRIAGILGFAVLVYGLASAWMPVMIGLQPFAAGAVSRLQLDGQSCGSRTALWTNVLHLIELKPLHGWGWGNLDYAHFVTVFEGVRFCNILDNAHNLPLHLAVELGIPVALLTCGLLGWLVLRARPWRETDDNRRMAWAVLALIGLHSLLEYPLWYGPFQIAVALAVWILWRTPASDACGGAEPAPPPSSPAPGSAWVAGCAAAVLLAVAYAGWDYYRVSQIYREPAQRAAAYRVDTLAKVQDSWLFRNQVRFATLTLSSVTPANAMAINRSAHALLHFSPEARVVAKLIDSALVLQRTDEAVFFMRRFRAAYPNDYARWRETREPVADLPPIDP